MYGRKGLYRLLRYVVNRSPNSVYGINLYLDGKINDLNLAYQWSLMDTVDAWAPQHDHPVSLIKWRHLLQGLSDKGLNVISSSESGQGYTAVLKKDV